MWKKAMGLLQLFQKCKVDFPETVENSVSVTSSQTKNPLCTNNTSEAANLSQEYANPPNLSGAVENALAQLNDGLGQP